MQVAKQNSARSLLALGFGLLLLVGSLFVVGSVFAGSGGSHKHASSPRTSPLITYDARAVTGPNLTTTVVVTQVGGGGQYIFSPDVLTITAGTTVYWYNDTDFGHNAHSDTYTCNPGCPVGYAPPETFQTDFLIGRGSVVSYTFNLPGTYYYWCDPHAPDQAAVLYVTGAPTTATPQPTPPPTSTTAPATSTSVPATATTASTPTRTAAPATPTTAPTVAASPTVCTISFSDVPTTNIFYADIQFLACRGVISGFPNGNGTFRFEPNTNTTRAQFAKIVVNAFNLPPFTPATPTFTDVPTNNVFYQFIEAAVQAGAVNGLSAAQCEAIGVTFPCYGPSLKITRAQVAVIVQRVRVYTVVSPATPTFSDVPANAFGYSAIETLAARGIIGGAACPAPQTGLCFRPNDNIRRGELSKVVRRAVESLP